MATSAHEAPATGVARSNLMDPKWSRPASGHGPVATDTARGDDDGTLYWLLLVVGLVGVIATLVRGGAWGAEPTAAALLVVVAGRALLVRAVLRLRGR